MNCSACGRPLPAEALVCSNCGTFTPLYYSRLGSSPYDPTVTASSEVGKSPMPPPHYGSDHSNAPPGDYARNPYEATPPPPPQTPAPRKGNRRGVIVGVLVGLVILLALARWLVRRKRDGKRDQPGSERTAKAHPGRSPRKKDRKPGKPKPGKSKRGQSWKR